MFDKLLSRRNNLKVIHLFRHPLAVMNSRQNTDGYNVKDYVANADDLCKRMSTDYHASMNLAAKYPGRVKMIFYEDLKTDTDVKVQKLYLFLGMHYNASKVDALNDNKVMAPSKDSMGIADVRKKDNAHWWRLKMPFEQYTRFYLTCRGILRVFNITYLTSEKQLRDTDLNDMYLPEHLLI